MSYPSTEELKTLYPTVGVHFLTNEDDTTFRAYETVNGKVFPYILFSGDTREDVERKVFMLWHWEANHKKLPLPYLNGIVVPAAKSDAPVKVDRRGAHLKGKSWVKNLETNAKKVVTPEEAEALIATGKYEKSSPRGK